MPQHFIVDEAFFIEGRNLFLICHFTDDNCKISSGDTIELKHSKGSVQTTVRGIQLIRKKFPPDEKPDLNCFGIDTHLPAEMKDDLIGASGEMLSAAGLIEKS